MMSKEHNIISGEGGCTIPVHIVGSAVMPRVGFGPRNRPEGFYQAP